MIVKDILKYNRVVKAIIDNSTETNALTKFKLLGLLKQFEPVVQNFEKVKDDFINKHGTTSKDGMFGIFPPIKEDFENDESFENARIEYEKLIDQLNEDLNSVGNSNVELNISKIKYNDIMDAGIPAEYLVEIYELIEE